MYGTFLLILMCPELYRMQNVPVCNQISAKDLNNMSHARKQRQKEIFVIILERMYSRIRRCASVSMKECRFDFPEMVFGHPLFDVEKCMRFVIRHLVMNGYGVTRTLGALRTIDISWKQQDDRFKTSQQTTNANKYTFQPISPPSPPMQTEGGGNFDSSPFFLMPHPLQRPCITTTAMTNPTHEILSVKKRDACRKMVQYKPMSEFVTQTILPTHSLK